METYQSTFALSFKDYCDANNLDSVSTEVIDKWKAEAIEKYQTSIQPEVIMNLFGIPDNRKKSIEYHEYTVEETGFSINDEKKVLYVYMKLIITK